MDLMLLKDFNHYMNIKGVKFNTPFLRDFLDTLDICYISEHWLAT